MTDERYKKEYFILQEKFKDKTFKFVDLNTSNPYLVIAQQTNSGKIYTIKIDLSNFPENVPDAIITNPKPLKLFTGEPLITPSHPMHTLGEIGGCTKICHYGPQQWHPNVSLYKIIVKIRVWLEAYETYLQTGVPLNNYLAG